MSNGWSHGVVSDRDGWGNSDGWSGVGDGYCWGSDQTCTQGGSGGWKLVVHGSRSGQSDRGEERQ